MPLPRDAPNLPTARYCRPEEDEKRHHALQPATRVQIEAELEERTANQLQAESGHVATEVDTLEAKTKLLKEGQRTGDAEAAENNGIFRLAMQQSAADNEGAVSNTGAPPRLGASSVGDVAEDELDAGPAPGGYRAGDRVKALCAPIGAATGSKAYILGEVAHRNPDGSLDVILSDGRMRQDVPLLEIRFIARPGDDSSTGSSSVGAEAFGWSRDGDGAR